MATFVFAFVVGFGLAFVVAFGVGFGCVFAFAFVVGFGFAFAFGVNEMIGPECPFCGMELVDDDVLWCVRCKEIVVVNDDE